MFQRRKEGFLISGQKSSLKLRLSKNNAHHFITLLLGNTRHIRVYWHLGVFGAGHTFLSTQLKRSSTFFCN